MVTVMVPRHMKVDARLWDAGLTRWRPLLPFLKWEATSTTDWAIDLGTLTLSGDHPVSSRLANIRSNPAPVSFTVNGVAWWGQITSAKQVAESGKPSVWECRVESDHKHFHRLLARDKNVSAADMSGTLLQGFVGEVAETLIAGAAQRTGLPTYILVEGDGDPMEVEARTEHTIFDLLQDATVGSRQHVNVGMLMPGDELPGEGPVSHYSGLVERRWEDTQLAAGEWPHADTHPRIVGKAAPTPYLLMPPRSWRGKGMIGSLGTTLEFPVDGICWQPFATSQDVVHDYFTAADPETVRVANEAELRLMQDELPGWSHHVTQWNNWGVDHPDSVLMAEAVAAGLVVTIGGVLVDSMEAAVHYVGGAQMWAWRNESQWVIANPTDFMAERERRLPRGVEQKQTPGVFVHMHGERDRRGVVFSSTPGGGLVGWSTESSAPDGAMLVAGGQLDERLISAARAGVLPPSALGSFTPEEAAGVLPSGSVVPGAVEVVDVDVQPLATIDNTDVSYVSTSGRVDVSRVGPFFYREKFLSFSGSDAFHTVTRAWSEAQGSTTMTLTPGDSSSVVFGDDVVLPDGVVVPGWRPGDRVSFVDRFTRISEVIGGYRLVAEAGRVVSVAPILGRRETGVMADLAARLHEARRQSQAAQLSAPQRLPEQELIAAAAKEAADAMIAEALAREEALRLEQEARIQMVQAEEEARAQAEAEAQKTRDLAMRALEEALVAQQRQPVNASFTVPAQVVPNDQWHEVLQWTTPESGGDRRFEATVSITWRDTRRLYWYKVRVSVNGVVRGEVASNAFGPYLLGNGRRQQNLLASFTAPAGAVIRVEVLSDGWLQDIRDVESGSISLMGVSV